VDFDQEWILTEGEWDTLAAIQSGHRNAVSLPDGAVQPGEDKPADSGKLHCIRELWDRLSTAKGDIILALDNDDCGRVTRDVLIDIFGRWRCKLVEWPEHPRAVGHGGKCKDLNEVLLLLGRDAVSKLLTEAKFVPLEGVFKPLEIPRAPPRRYYDIGIPGMEKHLRLFRGELCVVTGITGHGKTTFLFNLLGNLARIHGLQIGLGTFEADYWEDIHPWYETWLYKDGPYTELNKQTFDDTTAWMQENFTIISHQVKPLTVQASIEWFIQQAQDAKGRHGIDVLVLDPWNKVQHARGRGENETDYIGRGLSELRAFAALYKVIVIVTAHPTKEVFSPDGTFEMPDVGKIHGSMNWGNASDHVVVVFKPEANRNDCCFATIKSRYNKLTQGGIQGKQWYTLDTDNNRYTNLPEHLWPK
jgi:twinkle protein